METGIAPFVLIMTLIVVLHWAWIIESNSIDVRLAEFCNWKGDVYKAAYCRAVMTDEDGKKWELVRFVIPEGKHPNVNIKRDDIYSSERIDEKIFTMARPYEGGPGTILDDPDDEIWQITPA